MNAEEIHRNAIVVDGLVISKWSREVFEDMRSGGITAANCTCSVWEGLHDTLVNVAQWKSWFSEHADILLPVHTTTDIAKAKRENRVGIILGWQNTSGIEDRVEYLAIFKELGVHIMQLTYNVKDFVGDGCGLLLMSNHGEWAGVDRTNLENSGAR